ncbi:MAG: septation ring formation regulator EzrA [Bacilli bacterium]|nr:septation ring formation regulator EzrA [Bacilli bacterium]
MNVLLSAGQQVGIGFLIAGIVVVLGVLFFLLYHFVISRNRVKHQVRELQKKYSYLDALLIGQDSQYIHRLEIISRTNLLYVDKHEKFSRRFKEIYENDDKFAESMIRQLNALINNKQYKNIKSVIIDAKKAMSIFEEKANTLDNDLYVLIKPEEDSRQSILKLKENFRRVKQTFYANSSNLDLVSASINQVCDKLDQMFVDFETHIESAEYDEAQALLPTIGKVVSALESALSQLPNLCILVNTVIPEKIENLKKNYDEVESLGLPLFNLSFQMRLGEWNTDLAVIRTKLTKLEIANIMESLDVLQSEIEEVQYQLNGEQSAKKYFEENNQIIYNKVIELEKVFLKICSLLPDVFNTYVVTEDHKEKIEDLKQSMNTLGTVKQSLDNYVHSALKQPFSSLKNKLDELSEQYEKAKEGIGEFKEYVDFLKNSSEEAYTLVFVYYYRLKQVESLLREIDLAFFSQQYKVRIEDCYDLLNEIDKAVKVQPIAVDEINEKVDILKMTANALFDEIENKFREMQLAESAVVYANRDRNHQDDVHQQLCILEEAFNRGEFVKTYHEANAIFKRMHVEESGGANG